MEVYKFGGASIKNAKAVVNASHIINKAHDNLVVVVSAMGKTTNALEEIWKDFINHKTQNQDKNISKLLEFHENIIRDLELSENSSLTGKVAVIFKDIKALINQKSNNDFAFYYAQIVSYGEILSSLILHHYLSKCGVNNTWLDARKLIKTDSNFKQAKVNWEKTRALILKQNKGAKISITQGFIGFTESNKTTTLGREGSDFSASIFAWCLDAKSVTIWKDVLGVLNADPKIFSNTVKLDNISYKEAIELSFYGASVIHPKTIKPLQNKNITLYVKSFINPEKPGTLINNNPENDSNYPCYIYNNKQILISISPRDFSFIVENHISYIFKLFSLNNVKVHITQNSALNFSVCAFISKENIEPLILELSKDFNVIYNENVDLLTIRNHTKSIFPKNLESKEVLLQQQIRGTKRFVLL